MNTDLPQRRMVAGFTLLEVLVAIMVFAIMSVVAYRGLDQVLLARERLTAITTQWRDLESLLSQMGQVFASVTSYAPPSEDGSSPEPVFLAQAQPTDGQDTLLNMHVMGDPANPAPANALHRVAYRLRDGRLEFMLWAANTGQTQPEPRVLVLSDHVEEFRLRYLGPDGIWRENWPGDQNTIPLPWAVEVQVRLHGMAPVTRIYSLQ